MTEICVDPDQGMRFLRFLDGAAVAAKKPFLFAWIHPKHKGAVHELLTAEQWALILPYKQRAGWNSFVTVQAMNGERRLIEQVAYTRAFFCDFDGVEPKLDPSACPPDAIVQSKNGQHWYWRAHDPPHIWQVTETALVQAMGADWMARDLARVLRMPGSLHLKDPTDPFLVTLEKCVPRAPTLRTPDLVKAYRLDTEAAAKLVSKHRETDASGDADVPDRLLAFLDAVRTDPAGDRHLRRRPGKSEWHFDCPIKDHSHAKVVIVLKEKGNWTLFCQSGKPDCTRDNIFEYFGVGWGIRYAQPYGRQDSDE